MASTATNRKPQFTGARRLTTGRWVAVLDGKALAPRFPGEQGALDFLNDWYGEAEDPRIARAEYDRDFPEYDGSREP